MAAGECGQYTCKTACHYDRGGYKTGCTGRTRPQLRMLQQINDLRGTMSDWSKAEGVDPTYNWNPLPVPEMPERLLIDYATRCNLRCHMCPVWGLEDDNAIDNVKGIMDLAAARKMLDEFPQAQPMVAPSIYGEPLLIPNLREVLSDLKRRRIE